MHPFHILIVDESPDFAKSLGNMIIDVIGKENALVECTYNLQDGLKLVTQHEFHFVFVGVNLPSNKGIEPKFLFNKFKIYPPTEIVVVSFHNESSFRILMKEAGADKFLVKDEIDVEDLTAIFEIMK